MRPGSTKHAHGSRFPHWQGWSVQGPHSFGVPRGRRGRPSSGQVGRWAKFDRQPSPGNSFGTQQKAAIAQSGASRDYGSPPRDQAAPVSARHPAMRGASAFGFGPASSFPAAWIIVGVLLLGLALISVVSNPPKPPSLDELARASLRIPHERANSWRYRGS